MLALNLQSPPLLAVLIGVCSAISLRRGIRLFIGRPLPWTMPALMLALVLAAGALGDDPTWRPLQAAVNFGVLAALFLAMALDLRRHARDDLHWRFPLALSLPLLLGAAGFGSRALRALMLPESVQTEMNVHSALNVGSALSYIVLVLLMHATLMALVVARLLGQLQNLARRDPLTGLFNRRAMHAVLDQHARQRRRAADTFSLLMIDVDHFKEVNDRHGHETGDRALTHIARLMTQALRTQDRAGPLRRRGVRRAAAGGGSGAGPGRGRSPARGGAACAAGAWCAAGAAVGEHRRGRVGRPGRRPSRLLVRADDALYRAKRLGRDRVEAAEPRAQQALPQTG